LGPRGENGSILGGNILVSGSSEARYLVENNLSVHLFLDAGNVFLRGNDASSYTLRYSTGVGMRFLSPIGPIGFDIGHPLQERSGESSIRFHFNIGTSF
jgi:outer membrane translocation and assembly module TamA